MTPRPLLLLLLLAALLISSASAAIYTGTPTKTYDPITKTVTLKAAGNTLATVRVVDTVSSLTYYEEVMEISPALDFEFQASRITSRAVTQTGKYGAMPASITYLRKSTGSRQVPDYDCTGDWEPGKSTCTLKGYHTIYYPVEEWLPLNTQISVKRDIPLQLKFRYIKKAETGFSRTYIEPSLFNVPLSEFSWWDTNWQYRQQHTIIGKNSDNANNSVLHEPQFFEVYNTSGTSVGNRAYIGAHAGLTNMTDIRWVDGDDSTELYHWINETFNDHIDGWYRPQEIIKDQGNVVFLYYGNPSTTDTSNGYTTFLLYDHFDGAVLNATQWNTVGDVTLSNSNVTIKGHNDWADLINSTLSFGPNVSSYSRLAYTGANNKFMQGFADHDNYNTYYVVESNIYIYAAVDQYVWGANDAGVDVHTEAWLGWEDWPNNEFAIFEFYRNHTESIRVFTKNNVGTSSGFESLEAAFNDNMFFRLNVLSNNVPQNTDYLFVKKYLYPNSTPGVWIVETEVPPVAAFTCAPLSGTVPLDVTCTDASTNTPTSWSWRVENQTGIGLKTSTVKNPVFNFSVGGSGTFNVNLSATNAGGTDWENKTAYIVLTEPAAPGAGGNCTSSIQKNVTEGYPPLAINFSLSAGPNYYDNINWTFGDGNTSTMLEEANNTYFSSGTYTVTALACNTTYHECCTYTDTVWVWFYTCMLRDENGHVPVALLYVLTPLALGLSLFSVWNFDNRVYANIVLGGMGSSILWFFMAANIITGNIYYLATSPDCVLMDTPLFWLFILFGVIMTVYTLALGLEAIMERNVPDIGGD